MEQHPELAQQFLANMGDEEGFDEDEDGESEGMSEYSEEGEEEGEVPPDGDMGVLTLQYC